MVSDFVAAAAAVMATVNVDDILRGGGQGPYVVPRVFFINENELLQMYEFFLLLFICRDCCRFGRSICR
jgi:hypothetical protein